MALTENKRIQHIVDSSANIAADDFDGRLAYDTTEDAIRVRAGGVAKYASMRGHGHAQSDISGLVTDLSDIVSDLGGKVSKSGDTMTGDLSLPALHTDQVDVGADTVKITDDGSFGQSILSSYDLKFRKTADSDADMIYATVSFLNPNSPSISFFGNEAGVTSDVTLVVGLAQIQSLGDGLGAGDVRALKTDYQGNISSVAPVTREAIIQPLPLSNRAPAETDVVTSAMKSYGFIGTGTTVEELFYHWDLQHDYVAGTDIVFHVHWINNTTGGGNIKWQIAYQWVQAGAVWTAATTTSQVTAVSTTQWLDQRTDFTISGTGHTYNSRLLVRLFRDPADAQDTYTGLGVLVSVGCHYSANPAQP